jgi:hypothetical protein
VVILAGTSYTEYRIHLWKHNKYDGDHKTEIKVIGEPWFPGLTLKTVLN